MNGEEGDQSLDDLPQGDQAGTRRLVKSEAAFRTISEVAEDLEVPQHVLRFWEGKFPQVKPLKRGGGRRYYRPEDVVMLRRIRDLLYSEGYTIKGVQKLLREGLPKAGAKGEEKASEPELDLLSVLPADGEEGGAETDISSSEDFVQVIADDDVEPAQAEVTMLADTTMDDYDAEDEESVILDLPISTIPMSMSPELRLELIDILADLEELRSILQPC